MIRSVVSPQDVGAAVPEHIISKTKMIDRMGPFPGLEFWVETTGVGKGSANQLYSMNLHRTKTLGSDLRRAPSYFSAIFG